MKREELVNELNKLIEESKDIEILFKKYINIGFPENLKEKYKKRTFPAEYQSWYSKSYEVIKHFSPHRLDEFKSQYEPIKNRKELTLLNYTIYDAIMTIVNEGRNVRQSSAYMKLLVQIKILSSIKDVLDSQLNEITAMLEFDVFEKELDSAKHLLKNKYYRASGAICGVLIEKHLTNIINNNGLTIGKKDPSINDLNSILYNNKIFNSTQFKFVTYMADIRNKCDHNKTSEPTKEEIQELIDGTDKIMKTYN